MPSLILTVSGTYSGLPEGSGSISLPVVNLTSAVYERLPLTLSSGNNTVTVPTGASLVLLVPPTGNTTQVILKGVNGDTGISVSRATPFFFLLDTTSPPSSFVLNAAGSISGYTVVFF